MKTFKSFINEIDEEFLEEKNKPTSPEKWARAKAAAKSKFAVYPSAYANAWASKKYKAMGGGWRSTSEEVEIDEAFDTTNPKSYMVTVHHQTHSGERDKADYKITKAHSNTHAKRIALQRHEKTLASKGIKAKTMHSDSQDVKQIEEDVEEIFDIVEDMVTEIAQLNGVDPEVVWEDFETVPDEELYEVAAWQRKEGKSEAGGLNRKGIMSYRRENPGSKLSMAVTTKPSKLKAGSKAANRRKSFCARMGGMKKRLTSAKTAKDPNSRINKALRKWNC